MDKHKPIGKTVNSFALYTCVYNREREGAAAAAAKLLQSCPTLCDPRDGSPPGSAIPGILQERTLEWVAISFSKVIIGAWIYLWAFYFIPLIYISVFVQVPYCLDDCSISLKCSL